MARLSCRSGTLTGTILDVPDDNTEWDKFTASTKSLLSVLTSQLNPRQPIPVT